MEESKSLFNIYEAFTEEGQHLSDETWTLLKPLFQRYLDLGFKAREISHIISANLGCIESELVLDRAMALRKKKSNKCHI